MRSRPFCFFRGGEEKFPARGKGIHSQKSLDFFTSKGGKIEVTSER